MDSDAINYGGCGLNVINMKPCMQVVDTYSYRLMAFESFLVVPILATAHTIDGHGENYFIWVELHGSHAFLSNKLLLSLHRVFL